MTNLQFSLFFAALVLGFLLVHRRLLRISDQLRDLTALRGLDERIAQNAEMAQDVARVAIAESVREVRKDLNALIQAVERVEAVGTRAQQPQIVSPLPAGAADAAPAASDRIRAAIEQRLLALGYGDLRILSDLSRATLDEDLEVLVECDRNGMPHKGKITTRNAAVRDVELQSVAPMFP